MYIPPFLCGFILGAVFSIVLTITLALRHGKSKK